MEAPRGTATSPVRGSPKANRLIDVIAAAALYLEAPCIDTVLEAGKHVVIVMKQEATSCRRPRSRRRFRGGGMTEPCLCRVNEPPGESRDHRNHRFR